MDRGGQTLNREGLKVPTELTINLTVDVSQVWRHMLVTLIGGQGSLPVIVLKRSSRQL